MKFFVTCGLIGTAEYTIASVTASTDQVVTTASHGLTGSNNFVYIDGTGQAANDAKVYKATRVDDTTLSLLDYNGSAVTTANAATGTLTVLNIGRARGIHAIGNASTAGGFRNCTWDIHHEQGGLQFGTRRWMYIDSLEGLKDGSTAEVEFRNCRFEEMTCHALDGFLVTNGSTISEAYLLGGLTSLSRIGSEFGGGDRANRLWVSGGLFTVVGHKACIPNADMVASGVVKDNLEIVDYTARTHTVV